MKRQACKSKLAFGKRLGNLCSRIEESVRHELSTIRRRSRLGHNIDIKLNSGRQRHPDVEDLQQQADDVTNGQIEQYDEIMNIDKSTSHNSYPETINSETPSLGDSGVHLSGTESMGSQLSSIGQRLSPVKTTDPAKSFIEDYTNWQFETCNFHDSNTVDVVRPGPLQSFPTPPNSLSVPVPFIPKSHSVESLVSLSLKPSHFTAADNPTYGTFDVEEYVMRRTIHLYDVPYAGENHYQEPNIHSSSTQPQCTTAVQTDDVTMTWSEYEESLDAINEAAILRPSKRPEPEIVANQFAEESDLECDEEICPVEFEEVILERKSCKQLVGLTLCYDFEGDEDSDIYVGQIDPTSVAGKDGRIKPGDQILQINGVDVHSRNEAIKLFHDSKEKIILLLARTPESKNPNVMVCPIDDDSCQETQTSGLEMRVEKPENEGDGRLSADSAPEKDSGISRATDSDAEHSAVSSPIPANDTNTINSVDSNYKTDACAEVSAGETSSTAKSAKTSPTTPNTPLVESMQGPVIIRREPQISEEPHYYEIDELMINRQRHPIHYSETQMAGFRMERRQSDVSDFNHGSQLCDDAYHSVAVSGRALQRSESEGSLTHELAHLHSEMHHIQLECDRLVERYLQNENRVRDQVQRAKQLMTNLEHFSNSPSQSRKPPLVQTGLLPPPVPMKPGNGISMTQKMRQEAQSSPPVNGYPSAQSTPAKLPRYPPPSVPFKSPHALTRNQTLGNVYRNGTASALNKKLPREETSSAYNTGGDSCRSTPMHASGSRTLKAIPEAWSHHPMNPLILNKGGFPTVGHPSQKSINSRSSSIRSHSVEKERFGDRSLAQSSSMLTTRNLAPQIAPCIAACPPYMVGETLYTDLHNLQNTMLYQQKLLRITMQEQAKDLKRNQQLASGPVTVDGSTYGAVEQPMEWKVKRRADGSRYFTRRPVRSKMLKDRAQQLMVERAGITTDDDAQSEIKIGRYWSREERKHHLERAKARKQRQLILLEQKEKLLMTQMQGIDENSIMALAQKRQLKKQKNPWFDQFATIQECLAHGNRGDNGSKVKMPGAVISVTTV